MNNLIIEKCKKSCWNFEKNEKGMKKHSYIYNSIMQGI